jgi:hypothetical protein
VGRCLQLRAVKGPQLNGIQFCRGRGTVRITDSSKRIRENYAPFVAVAVAAVAVAAIAAVAVAVAAIAVAAIAVVAVAVAAIAVVAVAVAAIAVVAVAVAAIAAVAVVSASVPAAAAPSAPELWPVDCALRPPAVADAAGVLVVPGAVVATKVAAVAAVAVAVVGPVAVAVAAVRIGSDELFLSPAFRTAVGACAAAVAAAAVFLLLSALQQLSASGLSQACVVPPFCAASAPAAVGV